MICRVCGRQTDDVGTCRCISAQGRGDGNMARGADTLRRMADTYASLAEQAKRFGREYEAASYLRMWEELLTAAQEVEQKMRTGYEEPPHCTDEHSEFSVDKDSARD